MRDGATQHEIVFMFAAAFCADQSAYEIQEQRILDKADGTRVIWRAPDAGTPAAISNGDGRPASHGSGPSPARISRCPGAGNCWPRAEESLRGRNADPCPRGGKLLPEVGSRCAGVGSRSRGAGIAAQTSRPRHGIDVQNQRNLFEYYFVNRLIWWAGAGSIYLSRLAGASVPGGPAKEVT